MRLYQSVQSLLLLGSLCLTLPVHADRPLHKPEHHPGGPKGYPAAQARAAKGIDLGPRPEFLVRDMKEGSLKKQLSACLNRKPVRSDFSIGHRGAPLQFPEHTLESYRAGFRLGAGLLECDVTFTKDKELVCRHAQNDLATTTNILVTDLADTCVQPFTPAVVDADGTLLEPASAECRTSDITLAEFKTLRGKMDAFNPRAQTPEEFLGGTADFRTDLYSGPTSGTLVTHAESIRLFKKLGAKMTPELKSPVVPMPFDGFSQEDYARKMIEEYKQAGVAPHRVYPQSFNIEDVLFWVNEMPQFGRQAVFLDSAATPEELPGFSELARYRSQGINTVAPPIFGLLALDADGRIVPSQYARDAKELGFDIITWTLERSGVLADGNNGFYYQGIDSAISREGDLMEVIDVLARDVGVSGIFSDWPAAVSFYAGCMKLPHGSKEDRERPFHPRGPSYR